MMTFQNAVRFLSRHRMQASVASNQDKRYEDAEEVHGAEHPHVGKAVMIRRALSVAANLGSAITLRSIDLSGENHRDTSHFSLKQRLKLSNFQELNKLDGTSVSGQVTLR